MTTSKHEHTALDRLYEEQGQSPWIDFIDREIITSGRLDAHIDDGVRGLTSNPTIFAAAVERGQYDHVIGSLAARGASVRAIYEAVVLGDIGDAADRLRRVYDASGGTDGFASIEVEPDIAGDSAATLKRARELWRLLHRRNVFVKIPATPAGIPAIEAAIAEGIPINVTLLFGVDVYRDVAAAYLAGLRTRLARGLDVRVPSVASFFVSRVDVKVDALLDARGGDMLSLRGRAAIANAKRAYRAYSEIFSSGEFAALAVHGARPQRCLWASTSTKDPAYRDVRYVEELIGPDTVDTMPPDTIRAFLHHGVISRRVDKDVDDADRVVDALTRAGISLDGITAALIDEGVAKFAKSFDELTATIRKKSAALGSSGSLASR